MSNSHAIANVAAALQRTIHEAIAENGDFPVFGVLTQRPYYPPPDGPGVYVYLYRVAPELALAGAEDGGMGLRLSFLLSFYGDDSLLEPQRLLGIVAGALHAHPGLAMGSAEGSGVRVTADGLSLEEMARLWGAFFGPPYLLSMSYSVGPVVVSDGRGERDGLGTRVIRVRTGAG